MHKIENKQTALPGDHGSGSTLNYAQLMTLVLNSPSTSMDGKSFTPVEILSRFKIIKKLDGCDEIELEDAEFNDVQAAVNKFKWACIHSDLVGFLEVLA